MIGNRGRTRWAYLHCLYQEYTDWNPGVMHDDNDNDLGFIDIGTERTFIYIHGARF